MELSKKSRVYDVDYFDTILVTCCDIHGIPRGRFVFRGSIPGAVKNGIGMAQAALFCGILCDVPECLTEYSETGWGNGTLLPDVSTLKPLPWLSFSGKKMGHMLCDLLDQKWEREVSSSRQVALQQIDSLKTLGLNIVTSYDLEFTIFHKDTLTPVGLHEDTSKLVLSLSTLLPEGGLPVVSVGRGMDPGQLVISLGGQAGIAAADSLHQLHCALKSLCAKEGYDITLMTRPVDGGSGNRSSYNIALKTNDGRNVFHDANSEDKISALARHWVAGRTLHRAAVTALARPTLNCYSLTNDQDRLQVRASGSSVVVTDRLPSSSSNPYLVTGALIAAGLDGIRNKLEPTEKISANVQLQSKTPATFADALLALEEDTVYKDLIGAKLVHRFLLLKREFEVGRLNSLKNDSKNILEFEQSLYLLSP